MHMKTIVGIVVRTFQVVFVSDVQFVDGIYVGVVVLVVA